MCNGFEIWLLLIGGVTDSFGWNFCLVNKFFCSTDCDDKFAKIQMLCLNKFLFNKDLLIKYCLTSNNVDNKIPTPICLIIFLSLDKILFGNFYELFWLINFKIKCKMWMSLSWLWQSVRLLVGENFKFQAHFIEILF